MIPLPCTVTGARSTVLWGIALLIVIESMVVLSMLTSYLYLRVSAPSWPPVGIGQPALGWSTASAVVLVASALPLAWAERGIARGDRRRLLIGLPLSMVLLAAYGALSILNASRRHYTWTSGAYGSIVWTIDGYQLMHVAALLLLAGSVTVLAYRGAIDAERRVPVQATALYWYFAVASGLLGYLTVYYVPRVI